MDSSHEQPRTGLEANLAPVEAVGVSGVLSMPPTHDIMGHSNHFLPDFYEFYYSNGNFFSQNQLGSPFDIPCDLHGYDSMRKDSQPHYYRNNSFYAATYPPTTTSFHNKQNNGPLLHTNQVWSSQPHFNGALDSSVVPINVTLTPPTSPASQATWTSELPPLDSDGPNDDGQGVYADRKGHLLSPLDGFRLRDLPHNNHPQSGMPRGGKARYGETSSNFSPPDILSSPDSLATSPYLSFLGEPWMTSPASVSTDTDDDSSLASSTSSLSPDIFDMDTLLSEMPVEDEDDENFYISPAASPGSESIYHPLEQYPLHTSPHSSHDERFIPAAGLDDEDHNDLSPLTFSPPSLDQLRLLSLSEQKPISALNVNDSFTYNPPRYNHYSFDYDPSIPLPCSPSRRRSSTLPELEPTTFNADPFGLHTSPSVEVPPSHDIDMDIPDVPLRSLPGCETDDDLIPVELASKRYISDPSAIVPSTSTGLRSLLLWDHGHNPDRSDIPTPRSPSPEDFYLDPTVLAECADEEMQKVYELRQRTAKNEKREREKCRELSALLRLKLDERGVLGGGEHGNHQSGSRSLSCCSNSSFSSSPPSDSPVVYQPQPTIPSSSSLSISPYSSPSQNLILNPTSSSSSSTLPSTLQSERPKHKIRSMAQLVASMLFNRQSDASRQHLSKKPRFEHTSCHSSHQYAHPSTMGGAGVKVLTTPKSRLSKVILPEELEMDSEEEGQEVEHGDMGEEENEEVVDDRSLSRSCMDMDLDERGSTALLVLEKGEVCDGGSDERKKISSMCRPVFLSPQQPKCKLYTIKLQSQAFFSLQFNILSFSPTFFIPFRLLSINT
ncbi:hypothetical protein BYT27DRAFT_7215003 [Phlegmacium glaucopus]|nr:hypothetical protein BYT27DRAFT_7215003 [Phlegmacium glaucopus]